MFINIIYLIANLATTCCFMSSGIYWKIRDKSLLVSDRIKLVRYAWKHDSVVIPNKEQALLDWLCLNLAGKQRYG